jgi:hypothetical protein
MPGTFASADAAAAAARTARASGDQANKWRRVVTVQVSDGSFHVYEASIVNKAVPALSGASPAHIFGSGFAEYFNGSSWQAVADA